MLTLMRMLAALILVVGGTAQAQDSSDSTRVDVIKAHTEALHGYVSCLQTASESSPCRPPTPMQLPAQKQPASPPSQEMMGALQNNLKATVDATRAYNQCLKAKSVVACGPSPLP